MTTENKIDVSKLMGEKLDSFDCSQCKSIIFNILESPDKFIATQCLNGCLFCKECATKTKAIGVCLKCNSDAKVLPRVVSLESLFKNKRINCPNSLKETKAGFIKDKAGCQESVLIGGLFNHLNRCEFALLDCASGNEKCSTKIRKNKMDEHKEKCAYTLEKCEKCDEMVGKNLKNSHLKFECSQKEGKCPQKCEKMVAKGDIPNHILNSCANTVVECRYKLGGCNKKFKRGETNAHLESENYHIVYIDKIINEANANVNSHLNKIQQLYETINTLRGNDYQNVLPDIDENESRKRQRLPTNNNPDIIQTTQQPLNQQQHVLTRPTGFYFNPNEK